MSSAARSGSPPGAGRPGCTTPRHHLVVDVEQFDKRRLRTWLESRVSSVQAWTWKEIDERLGRLGYWEFQDYQPG